MKKKVKPKYNITIEEALKDLAAPPIRIDKMLFPVAFKDGETIMMTLEEIFKIPGGNEAVLNYFEETK